MPKNDFYERTFTEFATSLQKPIDLSQFSKTDSDTIFWNKPPQYNGTRLYMRIALSAADASFTSYNFILMLQNSDGLFDKRFIGATPQECVDKLNAEIDKVLRRENTKKDIWERYGF